MEKNKLMISFALLILLLASTYLTNSIENLVYWVLIIVLIIFYVVFKDAIMAIKGEMKNNKLEGFLKKQIWLLIIIISIIVVFFGFIYYASTETYTYKENETKVVKLQLNEIGDSFGIINSLIGMITIIGLYYNYQLMKEQLEQSKISQLNETVNNLSVEILKEINSNNTFEFNNKKIKVIDILILKNAERNARSIEFRNRINDSNFNTKLEIIKEILSSSFGSIFLLIKLQVQYQIPKDCYQRQGLEFIPKEIQYYFVEYMYDTYWKTMLTYENGKIQIRKKDEIHEKIIIFLLEEDGIELFEKYNQNKEIENIDYGDFIARQYQSFYNYVKSLAEKES